jgi:AcrR family transcriptional regulator
MSAASPTPRSTPTRQRLSEAERRGQILQATIAVVARQGFEAASATAIATQAGVSKGLIWHYFDDKTDLMRQAVVEAVRSIRDEVVARVDPDQPVPDIIRAYVRGVTGLRRARLEEFQALQRISSRLENVDGTPVFTALDYEELYSSQAELFRRGQAAGALRDFDARVMAVTYQGAIDAMFAYLDVHPDADVDEYADALSDLLVNAIIRR